MTNQDSANEDRLIKDLKNSLKIASNDTHKIINSLIDAINSTIKNENEVREIKKIISENSSELSSSLDFINKIVLNKNGDTFTNLEKE